MKVSLDKGYEKYFTIEDLGRAKEVIKYEKENDGFTAKDWAEYAVKEALRGTDDWLDKIVSAEAYATKNRRVLDAYGDDTGTIDVWVEAVAKTAFGYIEIGAYLSDIWDTGDTPYKEHMYIRYYKHVEAV